VLYICPRLLTYLLIYPSKLENIILLQLWVFLQVLFLNHPRKSIRDTSKFKPFRQLFRGGTPSLKKLSRKLLSVEVQHGEHNSVSLLLVETKQKQSPSQFTWAHWTVLISIYMALSQTPDYNVRPRTRASHGMCVYFLVEAGLTLPTLEGWKAESAYLAGYIPKWLTYPKTVEDGHPSQH